MRIQKQINVGSDVLFDIIITDSDNFGMYAYKVQLVKGTIDIFNVTDHNDITLADSHNKTIELMLSNIADHDDFNPQLHTTLYIFISPVNK